MELRSDIATAASAITSAYDVNREIRQLGRYLRAGETVQRLATGIYGAGAGLLAVTNHRVLFLRDGRSGQVSEGFPLGRLSSAGWSPDGARATISVSDSNSTAVLRQVESDLARGVVELIRRLADGSSGHRPDVGQHSAVEAAEALHRSVLDGQGGYGGTAGAPAFSGSPGSPVSLNSSSHGGGSYEAPDHGAHGSTGRYGSVGGGGMERGLGSGFLPSGRTLNGTGATSLFDSNHSVREDSVRKNTRELPDSASATTMTFNRPVDSSPGWTGVRSIPAPVGPGDVRNGSVPMSALPGSGSVPLPPLAQPELLTWLPTQQGPLECSGPLGLTTSLVGEVPITQLAAEGSGPFDAVTEATQSYPGIRDGGGSPVNGFAGAPGWDVERTPVRDMDAGGAVVADQIEASADKRRDGFVPDIEPTGGPASTATDSTATDSDSADPTDGTDGATPASLTAEGTERPAPISWRPPARGQVTPLRGPKASKPGKTAETESSKAGLLEAALPKAALPKAASPKGKPAGAGLPEAPSGQDFASSIGLKTRSNRVRWIWLTAGAAALVGLAAVGSVKLLGSNGSEATAQVSPTPAAAVNTPTGLIGPTGPVVQVSKVLAGDRLQVTGQYTGTVVVLGMVSPSGSSCGADMAKQYAIDTLNHQTVTLQSDSTQPATDASGRKLAYLELPNDFDYSTQAVGAGMAKYFDSGQQLQNTAQIKGAQSVAEQDRNGLWGPSCNGSFAGTGPSGESVSGSSAQSSSDSDRSGSSDSGTTSDSTTKTGTKSKSSHSTTSRGSSSSTGGTSTSGH
jgi:endonuclease YncB( thermonuclease family)